jgi:curved DNA-binding protein CbpA
MCRGIIADGAAVRKAYRLMAKRHHPDKVSRTGDAAQVCQYHITRPLAPPYSLHTVLLKVKSYKDTGDAAQVAAATAHFQRIEQAYRVLGRPHA